MSRFMFKLLFTLCFNDMALSALSVEDKYALKVIELVQKIFYTWKFSLSISRGYLKVEKCSWTIQDCFWNEGQCLSNVHAPYQLNFEQSLIKYLLEITLLNETRTLFGAVAMSANEKNQITSLFQDRVAVLTTKLNYLHMPLCGILLIYRVHWSLSMNHVTPAIHLSQQRITLRQFHLSLAPRIKVHRNFPHVLLPIAQAFDGLRLKALQL